MTRETVQGAARGLRVALALACLWLGGAAFGADNAPPAKLDQAAALKLSQDAIGKPVGDYTLLDRSGQPVSLASFRGKPLVVNLIYTGCFQICPTTTRNLAKAIKIAQDALGTDRFTTVTIGFNAPFDTPQAMDAYAKQQGVDLPNWLFLSPDQATAQRLAQSLGFTYFPSPKGFDHIEQVTLIDGEGRIYRQIYGDSFDVQLLVEPLKDLLAGTPSPAGPLADVMDKIRLFCTVYDPQSGTYRQNYAIYIEILAGLSILGTVLYFFLREWRRNRRARRP